MPTINMISLEWDASGKVQRKSSFKIRAEKPPVMPDNYEQVQDDVWQERYEGRAMTRLTTWTVLQ